jgi:hypothetical protein
MAATTALHRRSIDLPTPRGPLSQWLVDALDGDWAPPRFDVEPDPLADDDFQLALYCCYELSYRGFDGIDPEREWDPAILAFRSWLETRFELALRIAVDSPTTSRPDATAAVLHLLEEFDGPSLSSFMLTEGTREQFLETLIHRSAYQLKEADPHSWAIPRLSPGARKSAFIEIQSDEYGGGRPGTSHAEIFAASMQSAGLDASYGAYLDRLPGVTLATSNLISLFGLHLRLTGSLLGHLAVFEMTSTVPMSRYAATCDRLGFDAAVCRFYDIHVEADEHHGALARDVLLGGDLIADRLDPGDVVFGAAALLYVEDRFTRHLLASWESGRSSLRPA